MIFFYLLTCITRFQVSRSFDVAVGEPKGWNTRHVGGLELDERHDQGLCREWPRRVAEWQGAWLRRGEAARVHVREL